MIQNLTAVCDANPSCRGVEWMACEDGYYGSINYTYVNSPVHCVSMAYQKNHATKSSRVSLLTVVLFMLVASGIAAAQNSTLVMSNATALDVFHTTNDTFYNEVVPDFRATPGLYVCDDTPDVYEILPINAARALTIR
ncbi:hypothetical protein V1517DRAFT_309278 [Lipomyces orientalis]|uniref:Uncharacterized protein n=1 Tax=Lipomyces orientalis TaxID=1233043 RepID=A0ACC3TK83_9ASCO